MNRKTIYFVRHGESEANVVGAVQGEGVPDNLSELGVKQARAIGERAQNVEFDALISSDIERAKQTAKAISMLTETDVEYTELFREVRRPSSITGKLHEDKSVISFLKETKEKASISGWRYEDEENFDDLSKRAHNAFMLLENHLHENIMVVTHGHFLRFMVGLMLLRDAFTQEAWIELSSAMKTTNTGITVCTLGDRWRLLTWNDHAHFAD